ncbi:glycoside hydrolase family 13 protein [Actinoplanes subtropicus]|uniref:glycoside hydrolase family 13 protein n=1 Tax=Actinoplanes subtropicus TaxID=543632 RepID=UPI0004C435A5|nr:glycoside hydrolase family 13 protein [Actinoplanes subtropicus]
MPDPTDTPTQTSPWWRDAAIYQVYLRSFADGDGDGVGDIAGLRSRLPYLRDLGVDALWITPWYPSPMADAGYDVADYRDIDPLFGTLPEAEKLVDEAHELGLRVLIDLVPNHSSDQHAWFKAALAANPGSPERARYWFRPGRGPHGEQPPNNWSSRFGGPAWTRAHPSDPHDTDWYLHLFTPQQPDLNWNNPDVREEFEDVLRFWFDRGVDGFRIDVAHGLAKHPDLPDLEHPDVNGKTVIPAGQHPHWDRDEVPDIYRTWRQVADEYPGDRAFVAEAWVTHPDRLTRYLGDGVLQTAFNFDYLECPWDTTQLRIVIDTTLTAHAAVAAPATWVLSNHDVVRHVTRYGRAETSLHDAWRLHGTPTDLQLGTRRARAAALLTLALPGNAYIYQGEELGLWEIEDLPEEVLQDPARLHSGLLRDGCRVPLPWIGNQPPFGFTTGPGTPWLPQPAAWTDHTAAAEQHDPASMLTLYREALRTRRRLNTTAEQTITWREAPLGALAFDRGPTWRCVVNTGTQDVLLTGQLLLASEPLDDNRILPPDTTAWIAP